MNKNYQNIINLLTSFQAKEINHPESTSCNESKKFREEHWLEWIGSKNIVFHCKRNFYLVTTTWEKQIKARKFKKEFGSKDIRFASKEEIDALWLGKIWSVPPFGFENIEIPIFVDSEIFDQKFFIFNPSDPCKSIQIKTEDLKKVYVSLKNPVKFFKISEEDFEIVEEI